MHPSRSARKLDDCAQIKDGAYKPRAIEQSTRKDDKKHPHAHLSQSASTRTLVSRESVSERKAEAKKTEAGEEKPPGYDEVLKLSHIGVAAGAGAGEGESGGSAGGGAAPPGGPAVP